MGLEQPYFNGYRVTPLTTRFTSPVGQGLSGVIPRERDLNTASVCAKTIKGKGVSFMENQVGWHGKAPNEEQYTAATAELM